MGQQVLNGAGALKETLVGTTDGGYGTALPSSPTDGMEYTLVDSVSTPTYQWRLRYNAGSGNTDKWEFVGGTPLAASQTTAGTFTTNAAYIDPSNLASVTAPRAGVYHIEFGVSHSPSTANQLANYAPKVGAGTPVDSESIYMNLPNTGVSGSASRFLQPKTVAASDVIKIQVKPTGNGNAGTQWIRITPIRLS